MYNRFLSFILTVCAAVTVAQAYVPLPPNLDGSMMPIEFSTFTQPPWLPDSLKPICATYVSRHGARYLSGPSKLRPVVEALQAARNTDSLSDEGDDFFTLIERIKTANSNNWGDLSPIGHYEQRRMAERIYDILTPLGEDNVKVEGISSYMPRCVMTMYLLTNGLIRKNDNMMVSTDEGHQFDPLVCFFMSDREFAEYRKNGAWKEIYEDFVERNVSPEPARRLFSSTELSDSALRRLTMDIYEVLKANRSAGLPAPTTRWMSVKEYADCWRASNLQHYLRNTITSVSDIAGRAAVPLLENIIERIDSAEKAPMPEPVLYGYFGHAETLLPLLSLMRLPGCYEITDDFDQLDKVWKVQNVTPLGANLLILISRGPSGRHYVTLQLNGRSIRPVKGKPDIISWNELRDYWTTLIRYYSGNRR